MNYWLFFVAYDWGGPEFWSFMVSQDIAAQDYPHKWELTTKKRVDSKLKQMKKGDMIAAAFKGQRFGGYGKLTSDFYRGPSLHHEWYYEDEPNEIYVVDFEERFDCEWTVIPFDRDEPFIDCHHLKGAGYKIDLQMGFCNRQIDEKTFLALKRELDDAGARPFGKRGRKEVTYFEIELDETAVQHLRSTGKIAMIDAIENCKQNNIIFIRHSKAGHIVGKYEVVELEDRFVKVVLIEQ